MRSPQSPSPPAAARAPLPEARARGGLARYLLIVLLPLVLGPLLTVGFLLYRQARADLSQQVVNQLGVLARVKESQIDQWAAQRRADMDNLAHSLDVIETTRTLISAQQDSSEWAAAQQKLSQRLTDFVNTTSNADYQELLVASADTGEVIATSDSGQKLLRQNLHLQPFFITARASGALVAPPAFNVLFDPEAVSVIVAAPLVDPERGTTAVILGRLRHERLADIVALSPGVGATTSLRAYLVTGDGYAVAGATAARAGTIKPDSEGIRRAREQQADGQADYLNPEGQMVVGVYNWLPRYELTLLVEQNAEEAFAPLGRAATIFVVIIALAVALSTVGVIAFTRQLTRPIEALTEGALRLAGHDLSSQVRIARNDEIGLLAQAFNSMSGELQELYQGLERKVEERTRQLAVAAEVGRAVTSILGAEELLARTVQLIHDRFGYYHVSVFLLAEGEAGGWAVLRESTGDIGARLKAEGYRLAVGSNSIIGWVTANRQAHVASDVSEDPFHLKNELLPETRSEAAVPLRLGDRVVGALDVQSREPDAFAQADVDTLQILADQIAVAIENGRLFARQQRVAQLEQIVSSLTAKIYKSLTLDSILENAAVGLGRALGARRAVVRLKPATELRTDEARGDGGDGSPGKGER
jgi:methyl-accepting chemotaxis protein